MIYELRTYTPRPGQQPEYRRLVKELSRLIRGDRFGKFEGAWTTEFGTTNQLTTYSVAGGEGAGFGLIPGWRIGCMPPELVGDLSHGV